MQAPLPTFKVVSGPFIVENGKVLLVREQKADRVSPWILPGGKFEVQDETLEQTAKREALEELGITVTFGRPLKPVLKTFPNGVVGVLIAYVASRHGEIKKADDIAACEWHDLDELPEECEKNIYQFVADYKNMI